MLGRRNDVGSNTRSDMFLLMTEPHLSRKYRCNLNKERTEGSRLKQWDGKVPRLQEDLSHYGDSPLSTPETEPPNNPCQQLSSRKSLGGKSGPPKYDCIQRW